MAIVPVPVTGTLQGDAPKVGAEAPSAMRDKSTPSKIKSATVVFESSNVDETENDTYQITWSIEPGDTTWGDPTFIVALLIGRKQGTEYDSKTGQYLPNDEPVKDMFKTPEGSRVVGPHTIQPTGPAWPVPTEAIAGSERLFYAPHGQYTFTLDTPAHEEDYAYRLFLFTPGVGLWWTDPEEDICPP